MTTLQDHLLHLDRIKLRTNCHGNDSQLAAAAALSRAFHERCANDIFPGVHAGRGLHRGSHLYRCQPVAHVRETNETVTIPPGAGPPAFFHGVLMPAVHLN